MTSTDRSYVDFYTTGPYAPHLREHRASGSNPVHMLDIAQPPGDWSDPPTRDLTLIETRATGYRVRCDFGAGRFSTRSTANDLYLVPPETASDIIVDDRHQIRVYCLPAVVLRPVLAEAKPGDPFDFGRLHTGAIRNTLVTTLCQAMWDEAEQGGVAGRMFADGATLAIASALLLEAGRPRSTARGGLTPAQLRRATEYMEGGLDRDLSLAELAHVVRLSPEHFCRAFKQSTGTPPHAWLLQRRIERAKELLTRPELPLTQIGLEVGYASQGAFSTAFRRVTGVTPSVWRREREL